MLFLCGPHRNGERIYGKSQRGLTQRKREREAQQGWFESWFQHSPWLTTLVPTLLGPLIVLILVLTFGPCILNRLVSFIKERINTIQIMVLRQQYQPVAQDGEEKDSSTGTTRQGGCEIVKTSTMTGALN